MSQQKMIKMSKLCFRIFR